MYMYMYTYIYIYKIYTQLNPIYVLFLISVILGHKRAFPSDAQL